VIVFTDVFKGEAQLFLADTEIEGIGCAGQQQQAQ
jgi:hypothetical protein